MNHAPDPNWRFEDTEGHLHAFDGEKLPTLKAVITGARWCDECGESHKHVSYICKRCRKPIEPVYLSMAETKAQQQAPTQQHTQFFQTVPGGSYIRSHGTGAVGPMGATGAVAPMPRSSSATMHTIHTTPASITKVEIKAFKVETNDGKGNIVVRPNGYAMIVNDSVPVELTDIEVQVASEAAKLGNKGMRDFAAAILADRGIVLPVGR